MGLSSPETELASLNECQTETNCLQKHWQYSWKLCQIWWHWKRMMETLVVFLEICIIKILYQPLLLPATLQLFSFRLFPTQLLPPPSDWRVNKTVEFFTVNICQLADIQHLQTRSNTNVIAYGSSHILELQYSWSHKFSHTLSKRSCFVTARKLHPSDSSVAKNRFKILIWVEGS